jgi:hypothetical protein
MIFVFHRQSDSRGFHKVITKLARMLKNLEQEVEYVTQAQNRMTLYRLMQEILHDLNRFKECRINLSDHDSLDLRLMPEYLRITHPLKFWEVPVAQMDLNSIMDCTWDLTLKRMIPFLNGVYTIAQVAELADIDLELVQIGLHHLMRSGAVQMIDFFQLTNMYAVTPRLRRLVYDELVQRKCIAFVCKSTVTFEPTVIQLVSWYAILKPGMPLYDFIKIAAFPTHSLDLRRFIVFGVLNGWIRRLHRYPVTSGTQLAHTLASYVNRIQCNRQIIANCCKKESLLVPQQLNETHSGPVGLGGSLYGAPTGNQFKSSFRNLDPVHSPTHPTGGMLSNLAYNVLDSSEIPHLGDEDPPGITSNLPPKIMEFNGPVLAVSNNSKGEYDLYPLDAYCIAMKSPAKDLLDLMLKENIRWVQK